jgi:DinB superfamily
MLSAGRGRFKRFQLARPERVLGVCAGRRGKVLAMTELDALRYPIGRFRPSGESTAETRREQIQTLRMLPERLREAVSGLSGAQLDTPYRDGGWTVRQVVHHVADSHANSYIRFKLALTEDWPTIKPYDEAAWARLADSRLPIDGSLVFIESLHARWVALLASLSQADFERGFVHPQNGRQSLAHALAIYGWHSLHHTAHITGLRDRQGW